MLIVSKPFASISVAVNEVLPSSLTMFTAIVRVPITNSCSNDWLTFSIAVLASEVMHRSNISNLLLINFSVVNFIFIAPRFFKCAQNESTIRHNNLH
jgi:hypothetical protein